MGPKHHTTGTHHKVLVVTDPLSAVYTIQPVVKPVVIPN